MTANDYECVEYSYHWNGELQHRAVDVPLVESGNPNAINIHAATDLAKRLRNTDKVVYFNSRQIVSNWPNQQIKPSSRIDVTIQAWGEPFQVQVYDVL